MRPCINTCAAAVASLPVSVGCQSESKRDCGIICARLDPGSPETKPPEGLRQALAMGSASREAVQRHEDAGTSITVHQNWQRLQVGGRPPSGGGGRGAPAQQAATTQSGSHIAPLPVLLTGVGLCAAAAPCAPGV